MRNGFVALSLRSLIAAACGLFLALALASAIAIASGLTLTQTRLASVLHQAFAEKTLTADGPSWVECAVLTMQVVRYDDVWLNAVGTRWGNSSRHTCDDLRVILAGPPYPFPIPIIAYDNYPFGAKHLQAIVLSVMSLASAIRLYQILTFASIAALFLGALRNSPLLAVTVVVPICAALAFAFDQRWAGSTPYAPGYFMGWLLLAGFVAHREAFRSIEMRIGFFFFLGTVTAFFENLHGPIPVLLSMSIVLNQCFYGANKPVRMLTEATGVFAAFAISFVALNAVRLLFTHAAFGYGLNEFMQGVNYRAGTSILEPNGLREGLSLRDVIAALWASRINITGSETASTLWLCSGAVAWAAVIPVAVWRRPTPQMLNRVLALAIGGGGILLWYSVFINHTFGHPWLMAKMLSLPVSYGIAALAICLLSPAQRGRQSPQCAGPHNLVNLSDTGAA